MKQLTTDEFNTTVVDTNNPHAVYGGDKIAIVDFYADWCGPCKVLGPVLEEVEKENSDTVVLYKVDVDAETVLSQKFGIRSIPTVVYFKKGKRTPLLTLGNIAKSQIEEVIKELESK